MTDFSDKPAVNFICEVGDDDDVRDKLTSMGVAPPSFQTWKDREFSNEEQKAEVVRAIVATTHECDALLAEKIPWRHPNAFLKASLRREGACEWLSLCT